MRVVPGPFAKWPFYVYLLVRRRHFSLNRNLCRGQYWQAGHVPPNDIDGRAPKAAGIRAILPHVDRFLPMHNLASLADLGRALRLAAGADPAGRLRHQHGIPT